VDVVVARSRRQRLQVAGMMPYCIQRPRAAAPVHLVRRVEIEIMGAVGVEHGDERHPFTLRLKLLGHFQSDGPAHRSTAEEIGPDWLNGPHLLDVGGGHFTH